MSYGMHAATPIHAYPFDLLCCNNNSILAIAPHTPLKGYAMQLLVSLPPTQLMHCGRERENPCKAKGHLYSCILEQHTCIVHVCTPHCTTIQCRGAATQLNPTPRPPICHPLNGLKSNPLYKGPQIHHRSTLYPTPLYRSNNAAFWSAESRRERERERES